METLGTCRNLTAWSASIKVESCTDLCRKRGWRALSVIVSSMVTVTHRVRMITWALNDSLFQLFMCLRDIEFFCWMSHWEAAALTVQLHNWLSLSSNPHFWKREICDCTVSLCVSAKKVLGFELAFESGYNCNGLLCEG